MVVFDFADWIDLDRNFDRSLDWHHHQGQKWADFAEDDLHQVLVRFRMGDQHIDLDCQQGRCHRLQGSVGTRTNCGSSVGGWDNISVDVL